MSCPHTAGFLVQLLTLLLLKPLAKLQHRNSAQTSEVQLLLVTPAPALEIGAFQPLIQLFTEAFPMKVLWSVCF